MVARGPLLQSERHAAHHHLRVVQLQLAADDPVELGECRLRAGVEAARARRHHDVLQEHPVVEPAALLHHPNNGENEPDRRVEELVVAAVLGVHPRLVRLADAEQPVQVPAHLAPPPEVRLDPLPRVVRILLAVAARLFGIVVGGDDRRCQARARRARQHVHLPWLGVGAAGSAAGHDKDLLQQRPRHGRGQEGADRPPRCDRVVDDGMRPRRGPARVGGHAAMDSSTVRSGAGRGTGRRVARST